MKSPTVLDLLFGLFRLALAVFGLTWYQFRADPSTSAMPWVVWAIIAIYCLLALLILVWAQQQPGSSHRVHAWSALIDLALVTFLIHLSGGLRSPFYAPYIFLTAVHTTYFGLGFGLVVSATATVLFISALLPSWPAVTADPIRALFLLTLPVLTAFCCGVARAHDELVHRASIVQAFGARNDVASFHNTGLALAQRVLSLHAVGCMAPTREGLLDRIEGLMGSARLVLEIKAYAVVQIGSGEAALVASQGLPDAGIEPRAEAILDALEQEAPVLHATGAEAVREWLGLEDFDCGAALMAPIRRGGAISGALIVCAPPGEEVRARAFDTMVAACEQLASDLGGPAAADG